MLTRTWTVLHRMMRLHYSPVDDSSGQGTLFSYKFGVLSPMFALSIITPSLTLSVCRMWRWLYVGCDVVESSGCRLMVLWGWWWRVEATQARRTSSSSTSSIPLESELRELALWNKTEWRHAVYEWRHAVYISSWLFCSSFAAGRLFNNSFQ